jgi:hypothetical protein
LGPVWSPLENLHKEETFYTWIGRYTLYPYFLHRIFLTHRVHFLLRGLPPIFTSHVAHVLVYIGHYFWCAGVCVFLTSTPVLTLVADQAVGHRYFFTSGSSIRHTNPLDCDVGSRSKSFVIRSCVQIDIQGLSECTLSASFIKHANLVSISKQHLYFV